MSRSETVWIVDDDRSIRWVLEKALQQEGMTTQSFDSADGVMSRLARQQPDVIISDIRMPGASGLDLLARIREQHPRLPVIIMTGYGDIQTAVSAIKLGAFDYLEKPINPSILTQKIKDVLKRRKRKKFPQISRLFHKKRPTGLEIMYLAAARLPLRCMHTSTWLRPRRWP